VADEAVAEGALGLWQELILRIPLNQRQQLVQLALFPSGGDLAGYVDNVGTQNDVGRYGPSLFLSADVLDENDPDPCAPLDPRRGTYEWTLIHEFGHLRQYADGSVDDFVETFGTETGDGEGYPEDGSPSLDGDWVTSYAERAGGDEDAAESFTTYVMLAELPTEDSLAADKVHFFDAVPGYRELRGALRITEPGGGGTPPDAPLATYDLEVAPPDWLWGTWQDASGATDLEVTATSDDLVFSLLGEVTSLAGLRDGGALATVETRESSESFYFVQVATHTDSYSVTFVAKGAEVALSHERLGDFTLIAN
jgi:hypothetical protein